MSENKGKDVSVEQEERVAKLFKGLRTPQSGGGKWKLGDILTDNLLIECKTTIEPKLTYSIKKVVLDKAKQEAREMGRSSAVLAITLGEDFKDYFITDETFIKEYINLKESIKDLIARTEDQLRMIEAKASQLQEAQRAGGYEVTEVDKIAFQVHKNRLNDFLEALQKI